MDVPGEVLDLRTVGINNFRVGSFKSWDEFGNIVDLSIVEDAR